MKKFKCTVTKETIMEVEIDDSVWTPEQIKDWSNSFYDADSLSEVVEHLARMKSEYEDGEFIEGFGIPMIDGGKTYPYLLNGDINKSINICKQEIDMDVEIAEM